MNQCFFLSAFFAVQLLHLYIVLGNTRVWMILALVSRTRLCPRWSFLIRPLLPFQVSTFSCFLDALSTRIEDRAKGSKIFSNFHVFITDVNVVYYFCSHDFCLLDIQMQSSFGPLLFFSLIRSYFKSLLFPANKVMSSGYLKLLMFLPPIFSPPSSESSPVFYIRSA